MITVLTPATDYDLTELATVKSLIGISDTTDDALLSALITRASIAIAEYCDRVFAQEAVRESQPGTGNRHLLLERVPVVSIQQAVLDGTAIDTTEYKIEDSNVGRLWRDVAWDRALDEQPDYWQIDYTAGFLLPGDANRNLPESVEQACIETVKSWYLARGRDATLRSEEIGTVWQGTFSGQALPLVVKQLLAPWRIFKV